MKRAVQSVAVNLEPSQYLSGWRSEAATLFIPALSETRVGEDVAVRIGIYGKAIRATIFGKVALVRRMGRPSLPPGIELAVEKGSVPAARFLAMAARGEAVTFRERAPRFAVSLPVPVTSNGAQVPASTINVSDGGCSVEWQGPAPQVGDVVSIRLAKGLIPAVARAVVCWSQAEGGQSRSVGLRIISEGRAGRAWRALVAAAAKSGAIAS